MGKEYKRAYDLDATFRTYVTEYITSDGLTIVRYNNNYSLPEYGLGEIIICVLYVDEKIKHVESEVIEINQFIRHTDEKYNFVINY